MDLANIAAETQQLRGDLSACRSQLRTNRTRVADGETEEARLVARLDELKGMAAREFDTIGSVGTQGEPANFTGFGEPSQVAAE